MYEVSGDFFFFHPRDARLNPMPSTLNARAVTIVIDAIHGAWADIATFQYFKSVPFRREHFDDEDELSTKLVEILNDRLACNEGGLFRKEVFQTVVRDGKQSTAVLDSTEQMPDITFRMAGSTYGEDADESALFVEAKLVDAVRGCREYVINGLHRFVAGRYAPRITVGMLLAYATEDYADSRSALTSYFRHARKPEAVKCRAAVKPSAIHPGCHDSAHRREAPCPPEFQALHLWLKRPLKSARTAAIRKPGGLGGSRRRKAADRK